MIKAELRDWVARYREAPGTARQTFMKAAKTEHCGDHPAILYIAPSYPTYPVCSRCQKQPARLFETFNRLSGIAGRYTLPHGLEAPDIENYALIVRDLTLSGKIDGRTGLNKLLTLWADIKRLNPGLEAIKPAEGDLWQAYHCLLGVSSAFNSKDISDFIHIGNGTVRQQDPVYREAFRRVEEKAGRIYWIPSLETIEKINRQLVTGGPKFPPR